VIFFYNWTYILEIQTDNVSCTDMVCLQCVMYRYGVPTVCHVQTWCVYSVSCTDMVCLQCVMYRYGVSTVCHVQTWCVYSVSCTDMVCLQCMIF